MTNSKGEYLGDSVYAEEYGGMIKLTTNNGYADDPRNVICLEIEVYDALIQWAARRMGWKVKS